MAEAKITSHYISRQSGVFLLRVLAQSASLVSKFELLYNIFNWSLACCFNYRDWSDRKSCTGERLNLKDHDLVMSLMIRKLPEERNE
ncbi:hypothetical protein N7462_000012 [Penicillium macrosclerotiorum]|uniref:uncharacterized protein n=1 Tax=Penicillium macrosclerotiorum TaxID=303699 RepID=UPI002547BA86|nr:uncharacterized protein N7462_000012 [Penicillium macrosclerotiorum]KAJ5698007.1 hypothetical protein N7462_000012 [Penicillium macrosclerotiorum]